MAEANPNTTDVNHVHPTRVVRDGLAAGLLGAFVVAAIHLIADVSAGEPFRTPIILGMLFTDGAADATNVTATGEIMLRFTIFHIAVWLILGCIGSWLISLVDAHPGLAPSIFGGFTFAYVSVLYLAGGFSIPGLPSLHLWLGTLIGPTVAAGYLLRRHPLLARHIERVHLTETARRTLERALEHEAADLASYRAVAERFPGPIFAKMIEEKLARSQALRARCGELGLPPSPDPETAHSWAATTSDEALREALDFERRTIALYDRFLAAGPEIQIRDVFLRLRNETLDTTIPELEQAIDARP